MLANFTSTMFLLGDETQSRFAWFPQEASTFAHDSDWLFEFITTICILFFIPISFSLFYFAYRYHKPKGSKAESNAAHNTPLELAWSILPSFFLVGMFVFGAKAYLDHRTVPDGANELGVQAFKWGWTFDYGGGTFNRELHLLLEEPTKLSMRSSDVIHSLYIPCLSRQERRRPRPLQLHVVQADGGQRESQPGGTGRGDQGKRRQRVAIGITIAGNSPKMAIDSLTCTAPSTAGKTIR